MKKVLLVLAISVALTVVAVHASKNCHATPTGKVCW